jgi:hypothetical protein
VRLLPTLLAAAILEAPQFGDPGAARPPAPPPHAPRCDGKPPEIDNQDGVAHPYTLTCAGRVTERSVAPAQKQVLEGFSGCVLAMGAQAETLHTEMLCTVRPGGALSCDLL